MTITCEFCGERPMRTILLGALACHECHRDVLAWREGRRRETEGEEGDDVSRGPGLLMRKIVAELEGAENKSASRAELEDALCPLGFRSDNILRAVRTLDAMHVVSYREGRFAHDSTVHLFVPVENPMTNEEVYALLDKMMERS
jgi:hypothetical protein